MAINILGVVIAISILYWLIYFISLYVFANILFPNRYIAPKWRRKDTPTQEDEESFAMTVAAVITIISFILFLVLR